MSDFARRDEVPCEPLHRRHIRPRQHPALARRRQQHVSGYHASPPQQGLRPQPHLAPPHPDLVRLGPPPPSRLGHEQQQQQQLASGERPGLGPNPTDGQPQLVYRFAVEDCAIREGVGGEPEVSRQKRRLRTAARGSSWRRQCRRWSSRK